MPITFSGFLKSCTMVRARRSTSWSRSALSDSWRKRRLNSRMRRLASRTSEAASIGDRASSSDTAPIGTKLSRESSSATADADRGPPSNTAISPK